MNAPYRQDPDWLAAQAQFVLEDDASPDDAFYRCVAAAMRMRDIEVAYRTGERIAS